MKKKIKAILWYIAVSTFIMFFVWRFLYWVAHPELTQMQVFLSYEGWQLALISIISSMISGLIKEE